MFCFCVMLIQAFTTVCLWPYISQWFYELIIGNGYLVLCSLVVSVLWREKQVTTAVDYQSFYNFRISFVCFWSILSKYCQISSFFHSYLLDPSDLILSQIFCPPTYFITNIENSSIGGFYFLFMYGYFVYMCICVSLKCLVSKEVRSGHQNWS